MHMSGICPKFVLTSHISLKIKSFLHNNISSLKLKIPLLSAPVGYMSNFESTPAIQRIYVSKIIALALIVLEIIEKYKYLQSASKSALRSACKSVPLKCTRGYISNFGSTLVIQRIYVSNIIALTY